MIKVILCVQLEFCYWTQAFDQLFCDNLFKIAVTCHCRSIYATYQRLNTQKGIDVYRFSTPPELFQNHIENPSNQGFCTPYNNCLPSGLLNVENCHMGNTYTSCVYIQVFVLTYLPLHAKCWCLVIPLET